MSIDFKSIRFIINPVSGRNKNTDLEPIIKATCKLHGVKPEIIYTERVGHASQLSREAVENGTEIIVAVGGDGTINEVAGEMIGSKSVLGIIPSGSGNGLARHLGISRNKQKALQFISNGNITKIDTGTINGKNFISIAGLGFDALVANLFAESKSRGFFTYFKIVAEKYATYRPKKYIIEINKETRITTRALFLSFANSNQFGYNTAISPYAKLNDGKIDLCIVKKPLIIELPLIANLLLLKKVHLSPHVNIMPLSNFTVYQTKKRWVNIDGEAIKLGKKLHVKVNPLSLNVLIP